MPENITGTFKKLLKFIQDLTEYNVTAKVRAEEKVCGQNALPQAGTG